MRFPSFALYPLIDPFTSGLSHKRTSYTVTAQLERPKEPKTSTSSESIRQTPTHELFSQVRPTVTHLPQLPELITYRLFPSVPISIFGNGKKPSQTKTQPNLFPLATRQALLRRLEVCKPGVTIDVLHDNALLEIFDSYRKLMSRCDGRWKWQKLLHVCRRWRHIVLSSPKRLDLRIFCTPRTPTRKLLDIWPPFPISVTSIPWDKTDARCKNNIIAALERRDRVSTIKLASIPSAELDQIASAMEQPFPALTHLDIYPDNRKVDWTDNVATVTRVAVPPLPNAFLGRSAPCLQELSLQGTPFPALPTLVLSATHFHKLYLHSVPHAGYISPQAMVTFLLALPNLKSFAITFTSHESRPLQTSPPPSTRAILPSLSDFRFYGASEYLMDFIAQVDTPLLDWLHMTFTSEVVSNIPRLYKFLDREERRKPFIQAELKLCPQRVSAFLESPSGFMMDIKCKASDWPLESMTRLCGQLLPLLPQVETLEIHEDCWDGAEFFGYDEQAWEDVIEDPDWFELFNLFVSVKSLYIADRLGLILSTVLEKVTGERVTGILPALENLFIRDLWPVDELVEKIITPFVSARQLYDRPITVQAWEREEENLSVELARIEELQRIFDRDR